MLYTGAEDEERTDLRSVLFPSEEMKGTVVASNQKHCITFYDPYKPVSRCFLCWLSQVGLKRNGGGGGRGGAGGVGEGAERVECVGLPGGYVLI